MTQTSNDPQMFYRSGRTSIFASRMDQRFSYCCYLPSTYQEAPDRQYPLAVLVHGSLRDADILRDQFIDFAEQHQCILLAPLFPCAIGKPGELHNYKLIEYQSIRYDLVLLDMVNEIAELYRVDADRFLMHGFSGGGQFVHRFFYLHPDRLLAASIGAPGTVTLPDETKDWWVGTADIEAVFGISMQPERLRDVAVQMVIGQNDLETWDVTVGPKSTLWTPGINDTGESRMDRLRTLERALTTMGISVRFDIVPNVMHDGHRIQPPVKAFFADVLARRTRARR